MSSAVENDPATLAFAELGPAQVLDAVESIGFRCNGRLLALNSYENRVYKVEMEDGDALVAKFYRPARWSDEAIEEEHRFTLDLCDSDIPVVPPLSADGETLHRHAEYRFSIADCRGGRAPELDDHELLGQLGRLVARIHLHGETRLFGDRPTLDVESFGHASRDYLLTHAWLPAELETVYDGVSEMLLDLVEQSFTGQQDVQTLRIHGDFHPGNVLVLDGELHIVDLDDARNGPAVQDLWMFLSGDRAEQTPQLNALLDGYTEFRDFDARELLLIESLRSLRIMHYAAWLARRWEDPAFKLAFPWFDSRRYWDEHILALREQVAAMAEPPLEWC